MKNVSKYEEIQKSNREMSDPGRFIVSRHNSKFLKSLSSLPTHSSSEKIMKLLLVFGLLSMLQQINHFASKQKAFTPPPAEIRRANVHYVRTSSGIQSNKKLGSKFLQVSVDKVLLYFPPTCTKKQIEIVTYQLPDFRCKKTASRPFKHHCSFSYATRCPDAIWFKEQYMKQNQSVAIDMQEGVASASTTILVGCTNGILAANTLRMVSGNPQFGIESWKSATGDIADLGVCPVRPFVLSPNSSITNDKSVVHCIETSPSTANYLLNAVQKLGWQEHLIVHNAGLRKRNGSLVIREGSHVLAYSLDNFVSANLNAGGSRTVAYLRIAGEASHLTFCRVALKL